MRPVAEDVDTLRRVTTAQGRILIDGGGIFPDVELQNDTLRVSEQEFLSATIDAEFPIGQRIVEFGFGMAADRLASNGTPDLSDEEFDRFVGSLIEEGLDPALFEDPEVTEYLEWRLRVAVAQRMDDIGAEADVRKERDPVLAEAIRLLTAASTQAELFIAADEYRDRTLRGERGDGS
jgi:hypothetical protein